MPLIQASIEITKNFGYVGRGGSQAQFMADESGKEYIVKYKENGQNLKTLANEFIAGKIAEKLELPSPKVYLVNLHPLLVPTIPPINAVQISSGPHFGSEKLDNVYSGPSIRALINKCINIQVFPEIILFDAALHNIDRNNDGNYILQSLTRGYNFCIIDHGHCFSNLWTVITLKGLYGLWSISYLEEMYSTISSRAEFDKGIQNIRDLDDSFVSNLVDETPPEWLPDPAERLAMKEYLIYQRGEIENMLLDNKKYFKKWL